MVNAKKGALSSSNFRNSRNSEYFKDSRDSEESETQFLAKYDPQQYSRPNFSVDVVIFSYFDGHLHVLLVKRAEHPFKDQWSLVGGYVDLEKDKNLEAAAQRKLAEKTGVKTPYLEQLESLGNSSRDPRGWSVTVVYFSLIPYTHLEIQKKAQQTQDQKNQTGKKSRVSGTQWEKITGDQVGLPLAFDHGLILKRCIERFRSKVLYTSLPTHLMPKSFTIGDLQEVYQSILNKKMDPKAFRRRVLNAEILEETGDERMGVTKPAKLYRMKELQETHYFFRNIES